MDYFLETFDSSLPKPFERHGNPKSRPNLSSILERGDFSIHVALHGDQKRWIGWGTRELGREKEGKWDTQPAIITSLGSNSDISECIHSMISDTRYISMIILYFLFAPKDHLDLFVFRIHHSNFQQHGTGERKGIRRGMEKGRIFLTQPH